MNIDHIVKHINKVQEHSGVNILLDLNNGGYLLIEGSFSINHGDEKLVNSDEYVDSNFDKRLLTKIQSLLENKSVKTAHFSDETGKLFLELEDGLIFESFFTENDYESWELGQNEQILYGSECGTIIYY